MTIENPIPGSGATTPGPAPAPAPAPALGPAPAPAPAPAAGPSRRGTRSSSRVVAILTMGLGGAIVLGTLGSSIFSTVASASVRSEEMTVDVAGVEQLDLDLSAGSLRVEFADVDDAELRVTSSGTGAGSWTFERDESELVVASPDWSFGTWWPWTRGEGEAVLTLPRELSGLDASLQVAAGRLQATGDFGELDVDMGAGSAIVEGSASEVSADLTAGNVELDLADVREAELVVSAGWMRATFSGTQPRAITADVSAGSLEFEVPDGDYDVTSNISAGDFDNGIGSIPGAASTIDVRVSAGDAVLTAGR